MLTTPRARVVALLGLSGAAILAAALAPPVPQDPAYHRMADTRSLWGIDNALNVLSNAPFLLVGALGLAGLRHRVRLLDPRERWPWAVFLAGLFLTGIGSAYYHLATDNDRLLWDRLPLAVTFMGLFAAVIAERIDVRAGAVALGPLVALGIASVVGWYAGERRGHGDLRLYALVQFFPMLAIPAMAYLYPPRYTRGGDLFAAAGIYGVGKACELLDARIFAIGGLVSGHTLKHLAAALSGYWIWRMLVNRRPA